MDKYEESLERAKQSLERAEKSVRFAIISLFISVFSLGSSLGIWLGTSLMEHKICNEAHEKQIKLESCEKGGE